MAFIGSQYPIGISLTESMDIEDNKKPSDETNWTVADITVNTPAPDSGWTYLERQYRSLQAVRVFVLIF